MVAERTQMMSPTVIVVIIVVAVAAAFGGGYAIGSITAASNQDRSFTFVDDYNRTVSLDGYPQRIVSVAPTPTEMLFAVGAGDLIVGIDAYSDYPAQTTKNITKVGDFELNLEQIITLKPDLIVSSDLVPQTDLETLESNGIPYMIIADRTLNDVYASIQLIGNVTNHASNASLLVKSLKDRVEAVTNKTLADGVSHPKVYLEYWPMFTFGPGSFGDDIIHLAGGTNIGAIKDTEYPSVTDEFVVSQNPDIIIYTSGPWTTTTSAEIQARPGWDQTNAVSDLKICSIDDNLVSRYGPRIVDGLEQLAAIIHPDLFA